MRNPFRSFNSSPEETGEEGMKAIIIKEAIYESVRLDREIDVDM